MLGRDEEPAFVFGEAKSFAVRSFKAEDIVRMRRVSDLFPGAFVVFATLKDELSPTEKTEIAAFALWGREKLADGSPRAMVIALTASELFCSWDVDQAGEQLGGQRAALIKPRRYHLNNLQTLAELTQQVYLDLPDPHAQFRNIPAAPSVKSLSEPEP